MAESTPTAHHGGHGDKIGILRRIYAVIPIVVVLYLSYKAIEYLVVMLLVPYAPPPQITHIPARMTQEAWQAEPDRWLGTALTDNPRAPLRHYHHIDGWFQPDHQNDCTRSGCHGPLPHAERKETRAFLNMHATSVHCGVCHLQSEQTPLPLIWYDLDDGAATDPPALLQVHELLTSDEGRAAVANPTAEIQDRLVTLLRTAARQSDNDPDLVRLADEVYAPRYSSPQFQMAIELVAARLPLHFRGEYGAKLALRDDSGRPILAHPGTAQAIRQYLVLDEDASAAQRAELLAAVHPKRRPQTLQCTDCHTPGTSLVDLSKVGYSPARVRALQTQWVFGMIEHISDGQPFVLPGFVTPNGGDASAREP